MPECYTSDTAGHNAWVSQVQLIPYWQGASLLPVSSTNALYGSTVTSGAGGAYWLNGTYTGLSKTITVVPGAPVKVYITLGYLGTITTLMASETVNSTTSILASRQETQPNTYVLSFTPTTTSVTITMVPQMVWIANTNTLQLSGFSYEQTHYSAHNVLVQLSNKNTDRYEFGYNGQMKDNEVAGLGNHIDFGERGYDPRRAGWWSLDPLARKYPGISPYVFTHDNPIRFLDPDGRDIFDKNLAGTLYEKIFKDVMALPAIQPYISPYTKNNLTNYTLNYGETDYDAPGATNYDGRRVGNPNVHTDLNRQRAEGIPYGVSTKKLSEMGKVQNVAHESLHAFLLNQQTTHQVGRMNEDQEHDAIATEKYRSVLKQTMTEYRTAHRLGWKSEDIEVLSWVGLENTKAFTDTHPNTSDKPGYSTKLTEWKIRSNQLLYDIIPNDGGTPSNGTKTPPPNSTPANPQTGGKKG